MTAPTQRPTKETAKAREVCEANWRDGGFQGFSDNEWLAMLETMERQRAEAREALRELHEATLAPYPTFEQGAEAQNAWSERIDRARDRARAVIDGNDFTARDP